MGIIGSLIGGALNIGGTIYGGISASKAMNKVRNNLENQQKENQSWYDRRYNEDATQRADAQRILNITAQAIRDRNKQLDAMKKTGGLTEEEVAARNSDAMADAASQIAVAGDRRKDQIEDQYLTTKGDLNDKINNLDIAKANAISEAIKGVGESASDFADIIPDPKKWRT